MKRTGTLEQLAHAVGTALAALSEDLLPDRLPVLLAELGLDDTLDLSGDPLFQQKLADGIRTLDGLMPKLDALSDAVADGDAERSIRAGADVLAAVTVALTALDAVATDVKRAAASTALAASAASLSAELVERLLGYALVGHLERTHPTVLAVLELLTVVDRTAAQVGTDATAREVLRRRLHFDRLPLLINDPQAVLRTGYGWGTDTPQLDLLFERLGRLLLAIDILTGDALDDSGQPTLGLDLFCLTVGARTDRHPSGLAATLAASSVDSVTIPLVRASPEWRLDLELEGAFQEGLTLLLLPPARLELAGPFAPTPGGARFRLRGEAAEGSSPFVVLGLTGGSRLEAKQVEASVGAAFASQSPSGTIAGDVLINIDVVGGDAVLVPPGADGFLSQILPQELHLNFDFGLTWSNERGLTFQGAAGLEATLPVGLSIGGVAVPTLHLSLQASDAGLLAEVSASVGVSIGPVHMIVDRVGIAAAVSFPEAGGNLGVADLALRFKPPNGLGFTIDAPSVSGGGYLRFDPQKEEYSGMLELQIAETIAVKGIGLLTTRMPDGAKGYSLVVIIFAEGFAPIQLGLGFTLTGIGGLLAINRTCNAEVLREGIKNQTLSNILFPNDPIRNAPQIISSLNAVFPPQSGSYLFGPVVRINWGTPPVLTMDLGLVLEFGHRTRLLILGRVSAILPSEKQDLIHLQMNTVGIIDFDQKSVSLDAILYDSRLLGKFPLTGSMALRLHWGPSPIFALSIGGFHPAFKPPANFPALERIAISLSDSENFRLRAESYLAITANTVQFGAHVEMYAGAGGFSIEGMYGYDVLIQFDPFAFVADFAASVQLKYHSTNLFKVKVEGELSGPRPLHVKGKATFEIFWCDFSVGFDQTLIAGEPPPLPEAIRVLEKLKAALNDARNWGGQLADGERRMVTLRDGQDPNDIALHPLGTLSVKQSVVPLELEITKFGQAMPADAHLFTIDSVSINGKNVGFDRVSDFFAPAAFLELTDDEKLTAPSFEPMTAGVSLHAGGFITANDADLIEDNALRYETIILDTKNNQPPRKLAPVTLNSAHLDTQIAFGAAARSAVRRTGTAKYRPAGGKNALGRGGWMIVSAADQSHQAAPGIEAGKQVSYAAAFQALRTLKQENPARAKGLMIIRRSEMVR